MKILILGHNGFIGSYLYKYLDKAIFIDVLSKRNVYNNGHKYDYVINCIGTPNVKYCEDNIIETNYSNWLVLEDIIKYYPNAKIINFSSNAVYDGEGLNNEESNTINSYAYANQKLNGEKLVKNGVTFRIGTMFGHDYQQPGKFIDYIINKDNLTLDSVLFNLTSMRQILRVVEYELKNNNLFGIYNLANLGVISHYDFGIEITKMLGLNKNIIKINNLVRTEPNYGRYLMNVSKLNLICPLIHWREDCKIKI